jgi:hypothetical protein
MFFFEVDIRGKNNLKHLDLHQKNFLLPEGDDIFLHFDIFQNVLGTMLVHILFSSSTIKCGNRYLTTNVSLMSLTTDSPNKLVRVMKR